MTTTQQDVKKYAVAYMRGKDMLNNISAETITELHEYVRREYNKIQHLVYTEAKEIDCDLMREKWAVNGKLFISTLHNNSPLFPESLNIQFRAIHDYIHLTKNFGCDYEGEYLTFLEQSKGLSNEAKQVLFSEIVLQACYCLYTGNFADVQKVVLYRNPEFLELTDNENMYISLLTM